MIHFGNNSRQNDLKTTSYLFWCCWSYHIKTISRQSWNCQMSKKCLPLGNLKILKRLQISVHFQFGPELNSFLILLDCLCFTSILGCADQYLTYKRVQYVNLLSKKTVLGADEEKYWSSAAIFIRLPYTLLPKETIN